MNLKEFRDHLNSIPEEHLFVEMVAAKFYPVEGSEEQIRLDMPILSFSIYPETKEAVFQIKSDESGYNHLLNIIDNLENESSNQR